MTGISVAFLANGVLNFYFFFIELCRGKAMVAYTKPQQRKKEESERLGERERERKREREREREREIKIVQLQDKDDSDIYYLCFALTPLRQFALHPWAKVAGQLNQSLHRIPAEMLHFLHASKVATEITTQYHRNKVENQIATNGTFKIIVKK